MAEKDPAALPRKNVVEYLSQFKDRAYRIDIYKRVVYMMVGFLLIGYSNVMSLNAGLGMNSWGSFFVGVSNHTPFTMGQVTQLFTLLFIIMNLFFHIYPMLGTLCDMFFVGYFIDFFNASGLVPSPTSLPLQILWCLLSVVVLGVGIGIYMNANLGSGPRDGLMMGLYQRFHINVKYVRIAMDAFALVLAFLLGGPIGIGTIIITFGLGYVVERALLAFELPFRWDNLRYLITKLHKIKPGEKVPEEVSYKKETAEEEEEEQKAC